MGTWVCPNDRQLALRAKWANNSNNNNNNNNNNNDNDNDNNNNNNNKNDIIKNLIMNNNAYQQHYFT